MEFDVVILGNPGLDHPLGVDNANQKPFTIELLQHDPQISSIQPLLLRINIETGLML
jgi:hypothetical protein